MKHLSFTIFAALTLGASCLTSISHAQDPNWQDRGYVEAKGSVEIYTSFPDPQHEFATWNMTSAFAKTTGTGQAHATGACTKDFVYVGDDNPVYKSIYEEAQLHGEATPRLSPYMPPTNPISNFTTYLISFTLTGTQNDSKRQSMTVGIPLRLETTIHRSLSFYVEANDASAVAAAMGSIAQF